GQRSTGMRETRRNNRALHQSKQSPVTPSQPHVFTAVCSTTVPPVQTGPSTFPNPRFAMNSVNTAGWKNRATDFGRYVYAALSPEINPPSRGSTARKYQRYKSPNQPDLGSVNSNIASVPPAFSTRRIS